MISLWSVPFFGFAAVLCLLFSCCPTAVARLVIAFVVDAVKGKSLRRTGAHVFEKALEPQPPVADRYTSPAVVMPKWRFWIAATSEHSLPRQIGRRFNLSIAGMSVLSDCLFVKAAATEMLPKLEVASSHQLCFPAIALALPTWLVTKVAASSDDDKPSEAVPSDVNKLSHSHWIMADAPALVKGVISHRG